MFCFKGRHWLSTEREWVRKRVVGRPEEEKEEEGEKGEREER